ncbi:UNVERIFIED_CONTAM: helix-turn-helix domain-containing protein [Kocuria sp. CPCC 205316]|uniref:helix-turn-helix domain-containing protein n=1 Tax=Kocuria TaxID=57493 RepID=UPI0036DB0C65
MARANGKLKGKPPKLSPARQRHLIMLWEAGSHTQVELAELFEISRTTIYREIKRYEAAQRDRPAMFVEESKVV